MICIRDRVRFVETDTMGVVHHSKYLHWFEMGRAALLRAAGLSLNDLMDAGILFPIAEVDVKYKNSCNNEADISICPAEFQQKI